MSCRFSCGWGSAAVPVLAAVMAWALPVSAACGQDDPAAAVLDFRQVIRQARERVFPAVIYIKSMRESLEGGKTQTQEVTGSGVIISSEGLALTNWHVIERAVEVRALLTDGRHVSAAIVGSDKIVDLGLLQLELPDDFGEVPYAELGESLRLTEGDFVMAMGAPWGLNRSVTIGIISCTNRYLPDRSEYSLWLQTDAGINPGNSGGPLVNTEGQVVGVNTLGTMWGATLGFTIPSDTIQQLLPQLQEHGRINWTWSGIQLQPLRDFNRNMYFSGDRGVIVAQTDPESPARRGGLRHHDRILSVNGQAVAGKTGEDLPAIRRMLALLPVDKPATLQVLRGEQVLNIELTPRYKGEVEGGVLDCRRWDFTAKAINQFENPTLWFHRQEGVFIFGVRYPGNAQNARLREQDIILKIGERDIHTLDDVREAHEAAMQNIAEEHRVRFTVLRNGLMRQVVLDFSRDYERN